MGLFIEEPDEQPEGIDENKGRAFAIASIVLGLLSLVLFCVMYNILSGILAVICGVFYLAKGYRKWKTMAIAGIILGAMPIAAFILMIVISVVFSS